MKNIFILIIILLSALPTYAKDAGLSKKIVGIQYFKPIFGHIRVHPSKYSESLSAISCGHPVKLYETLKGDFQYAKVGPYVGFIKRSHLSKKKPKCFQDKYPKFYVRHLIAIYNPLHRHLIRALVGKSLDWLLLVPFLLSF